MPKIDLVPVMRKAPGQCGICHTTPTENGKPKLAIDTNVDVNWGDNLYVCDECLSVIAGLMGWITPEEYEQMQRDYNELEKAHERLRRRFKKQEAELKALAKGEKVRKRVRKRDKQHA